MTKAGQTATHAEHLQSCVMHNRLYAISAMVYSLVVSVASWREIGRPFSGHPEPLQMIVGLPVFAAVAVYLFLAVHCVWERLWLGPAAAGLLVSVAERFEPQWASYFIGGLRIVSLVLWLSSLVVSIRFVGSAFAGGASRVAPTAPPEDSRTGPREPASRSFGKWMFIVFVTYPVALAVTVGFAGLPSGLSFRSLLLPCAMLLYSLFVFAVFLYWARAAHDQPKVGALRIGLGVFFSSSLLGLVIAFSAAGLGIVSPAAVLEYFAPCIPAGAGLVSIALHVIVRRRLEASKDR